MPGMDLLFSLMAGATLPPHVPAVPTPFESIVGCHRTVSHNLRMLEESDAPSIISIDSTDVFDVKSREPMMAHKFALYQGAKEGVASIHVVEAFIDHGHYSKNPPYLSYDYSGPVLINLGREVQVPVHRSMDILVHSRDVIAISIAEYTKTGAHFNSYLLRRTDCQPSQRQLKQSRIIRYVLQDGRNVSENAGTPRSLSGRSGSL